MDSVEAEIWPVWLGGDDINDRNAYQSHKEGLPDLDRFNSEILDLDDLHREDSLSLNDG